jgi:NAD(P)H-quinone oxidoreductase subunit 6
MMSTGIGAVVFFALAVVTIAGSAIVAFSRNIVHSAFALLATFIGVAGMYATLSADFIAVIQVLVYVGGILILILFAVMLTSQISEAKVSNSSLGLLPGILILGATAALLVWSAVGTPWKSHGIVFAKPTTAAIGDALLGPYVLPFELVSVLLFAALLGALTLARGKENEAAGKKAGGEASK